MDDLLNGSDTIEGAANRLTQNLKKAREYVLNLRKIKANTVAIIMGFSFEAVETPQTPKEYNESTTNMLGLLWTLAQDCF
jgi:hypothetical protein